MRSKVVLVAFLLMFYIIPMILGPSYTSPSIADESNFTLSSGANWLSGWDYRRSHIVNGSAGAGTDYQVLIKTYYNDVFSPTLTYDTNWADKAHQGVATDGTYIYTTNSTMISKYQKDGTFISSHDCSGDGTYDTLGDLFYYDGALYVAAHSGGSPWHGKAMSYDTDLSYNGEFSLTDITNPTGAPTNIAYGNGSFWVVEGWEGTVEAEIEIQRYDLSWVFLENWTIANFEMESGPYGYQGFDSIDENFLIAVPHEGVPPDKIDFYYFNGSAFSQYTRIDRPEWTGDDSSIYEACQGVAVEIDGDITYIWFASRNNTGITQHGEVARYTLGGLGNANEVGLNANCRTDFGDVRFTDNDGFTELDYWLEEKTDSSNATFWIEVADDLGSDQYIYVYYGNAEASTTSDGSDTFLLFDDFNDGSINATLWDTDGATESGGIMSIATGDKYIRTDNTFGPDVALEARMEQAGLQRKNYGFSTTFPASGTMWICHDSDGDSFTYEGNDDAGTLTLTSGTYEIQSLMWKEDYGGYSVDREEIQTRSDGDIAAGALKVGMNTWASSTDSIAVDWLFLRAWVSSEPAHHTWGEEEIYSPPEWEEINDVAIIFQVNWSPEFQFGYDAFFIFLGLIMIPASTMYLARGGRKEMSRDKLFYGLVTFVLGIGFLIGGILP